MKYVAVNSSIKCLHCGNEEPCKDYNELNELLIRDDRFMSMPEWQKGSALDCYRHTRFI